MLKFSLKKGGLTVTFSVEVKDAGVLNVYSNINEYPNCPHHGNITHGENVTVNLIVDSHMCPFCIELCFF
jgi:hypothetical protein